MKPSTSIALDGMEVLQIQLMEIHLRHAAECGYSMGVRPQQIRTTVAYWLDRIGHDGVSPRASWKTLHQTWTHVFGSVLDLDLETSPNPNEN